MMKRCATLLIGTCLTIATPQIATSTDTAVGIGTLRCTLGPGSATESEAPKGISCLFKPHSGVSARYEGELRKLGDPAPTMDKLVLLWAVFANDETVDARALEGIYVGTIDDETTDQPQRPRGALTGGPDAAIELRPFTRVPDSDDDTPLVLELELKSTRV